MPRGVKKEKSTVKTMSGRSFSEDTRKRRMEYSLKEVHRGESDEETEQESATERPQQLDQIQTFAGYAAALSSGILAEHLLAYPCIVLRRQCQVHNGHWYHTLPFSIFPVVLSLQRQQGISTLWKGMSSVYLTKAIFYVSENVVSEVTPFPREISRHHSLGKHAQHLALKLISFVVTTPFLASSFIETVESDISSEKPGVFDFIKEGASRLMNWGMPQTTRLLPVWQLIPPTVVLGLSSYMIVQLARYTVLTTYRLEEQETRNDLDRSGDGQIIKSMYDKHFPNLLANFTGYFIADMMLFPLETVLHRLYLQGTRTIIDNMDTGTDVVPIGTDYTGVIDCFKQIISEEGISGLYRGFGALLLQFAIHGAIIRLSKDFFERFSVNTKSKSTSRKRTGHR